jgi:hypothetical protein
MGTVLKILAVGVAGFVVWRIVVAVRAGASVKSAIVNPTANVNNLAAQAAAERKANTGASHF